MLCFFVSSSDALFRFTFVHTAKLKKLNFLNDFFLSLTALARVTSFLTLFSKSFFLRDQILITNDLSSSLYSQWKFFEFYVRTCPALRFISSSRFLLRPYGVTTTSNLILFIRSCNFNWIACMTSFFTLIGWRFFLSYAWLSFWSHVTYLTLKNDFLTLKLTLL